MNSTRKAIFLDRDGVLNALIPRDGGMYSPRNVDEFELFPWTSRALSRLADNGYQLVVVTNQPDIATGLLKVSELEKMHELLRALTPIQHIFVCPHISSNGCVCRKPLPGLLMQAAHDLKLNLSTSWTVGDRTSDIEAGRRAGTRTVFVRGGQQVDPEISDTFVVPNLYFGAIKILSEDTGLTAHEWC